MKQYRSALQSVARSLNDYDWSSTCPVSDHFVIVPADGSNHFNDDEGDMKASIPQDKMELLRQLGKVGPDNDLTGYRSVNWEDYQPVHWDKLE